MLHRVKDKLSVPRSAAAKRCRRTLLRGVLSAAIACVPLGARAVDVASARERHSSGVVMMIGGMTSDGDTGMLPARAVSVAPLAAAGDAGRQSVVIQPGSPALNGAIRQTSALVALRVRALSPIIDEAARVVNVDSALLMAVIDVESGGDPQAVSPKGATGLMQLMPGTGARHGASNLFDPRQNIAAGARYLKELMRQFGELPLALAAYNAGEGAVQKYGGRIPPYAETMSYVPKVIARYRWYQDASFSADTVSVQTVPHDVRGRFLLIGPGGTN
ncbi:soluble lytic murein transglycosylase-like protein [Burkholderia sp. Ch1-1]|nr:soluble lytic murein transglycosylase-like protein [Burkholderia sp. Ch1-1]